MQRAKALQLHKNFVWVEAQREELRHEGIPLLATLPLGYLVGNPSRELKEVGRGFPIKEEKERDQLTRTLQLVQPAEHRRASDVVIRADAIQAEQDYIRGTLELGACGVVRNFDVSVSCL